MSIARGTHIKEAQRKAQNKYEAKTYKTVGCKMPRKMAEQFIDMVKSDPAFIVGDRDEGSVNAALMSFITAYMESNGGV